LDYTRSRSLSGTPFRHAALSPDKPSSFPTRRSSDLLYQPAGFGLDVGPKSLITGSVESILKAALSIAAALLPASSVQALELTLNTGSAHVCTPVTTGSRLPSAAANRNAALRPDKPPV